MKTSWMSGIRLDGTADQGGGAPPAPPAGGTPPLNDFIKGLPADLQTEKSLHNYTNPVDLAKGFVHAQKLIGAKRLEAPLPTWGESEYNGFYEAVGRPKTADEYKIPTIEGVDPKSIPEAAWKKTAGELHKAGLTQKQVDAVLGTYFRDQVEVAKTTTAQREADRLTKESALKAEWGDKFDSNLSIARSVVTKFGDQALNEYIADGGGNDPRLIKALANIGKAMLEDTSRGGNSGTGLQITDQARATQEISRLKLDPEFRKALTDKNHPGHAAAVQQNLNLHKVAAPGQVQPA